MTLKQYISISQIEYTTSSFPPALIAVLYAWYNYESFHLAFSLLGLLTVTLFQLAVGIRDNYVDYYTADDKNADYTKEMAVAKAELPLKKVRSAYYLTGAAALILALFLVLQTSFLLFYIAFGGILIGILYTSGPLPIASTPFGEFFIGLSYGFSIFASMVYINAFDVISFDWITTGQIITASIPTAITVMAILLANNICDLEEDIEDGRFTLPYHIGTDKALVVFKYFYYAAYIAVILSVIFATFPRLVTLSLLTFPYVLKNIRIFMKEQDKETTFMTTIINSVVIPVPIIITFFLGAWMGI